MSSKPVFACILASPSLPWMCSMIFRLTASSASVHPCLATGCHPLDRDTLMPHKRQEHTGCHTLMPHKRQEHTGCHTLMPHKRQEHTGCHTLTPHKRQEHTGCHTLMPHKRQEHTGCQSSCLCSDTAIIPHCQPLTFRIHSRFIIMRANNLIFFTKKKSVLQDNAMVGRLKVEGDLGLFLN